MNAMLYPKPLYRLLGNGKIHTGFFAIKVDRLSPLTFTDEVDGHRFVDQMRSMGDK